MPLQQVRGIGMANSLQVLLSRIAPSVYTQSDEEQLHAADPSMEMAGLLGPTADEDQDIAQVNCCSWIIYTLCSQALQLEAL